MTQTTPSTSAQGTAAGWRYSINYGPDGEENYANVYAADGQIVGNLRTHHAIAICNAFAVCDSLTASPPPAASPASPSGVRDKLADLIDEVAEVRGEHISDHAILQNADEIADAILKLLASDAPPAPTSGSEATCNASLQVAAIPRAENTGRYLAETNDGRLLYLNHAYQWQEMPNILAKPAPSPAGDVRGSEKGAEGLHGPFGYLVIAPGLNEEHWHLRDDPEPMSGYVSLPLFTKVDPFDYLPEPIAKP